MPTGYTATIKDGISFEKFVWTCARAFGALVTMRDDPQESPIPQRLEPSPFYLKNMQERQAAIADFDALDEAQFAERQRLKAAREAKYRADSRLQAHHQAMLYRDMLARVEAWTPPTGDHAGLKEFMASQIKQSIDWDCDTSHLDTPAAPTTRDEERLFLKRDFEYAAKSYAEELERVASRNAWIDALRASVPEPRS